MLRYVRYDEYEFCMTLMAEFLKSDQMKYKF